MSRYDFLEARWVILINLWTDSQLDLISRLANLLDELGQIMARYDFLEAIRVIMMMLSNVLTDSILTWFHFRLTFDMNDRYVFL